MALGSLSIITGCGVTADIVLELLVAIAVHCAFGVNTCCIKLYVALSGDAARYRAAPAAAAAAGNICKFFCSLIKPLASIFTPKLCIMSINSMAQSNLNISNCTIGFTARSH